MKPTKGMTRAAWMKTAVPHFIAEGDTPEAATEKAASLFDAEGDFGGEARREHVTVKSAIKRVAFSAEEVAKLCKARGIEYVEGMEKRVAVIVASDERVDRDGDVVIIDGIDTKTFMTNPVLMYSHDLYRVPIGAVLEFNKEKDAKGSRLVAKVLFQDITQDAKEICDLVMSGFIRATSIGFFAKKGGVKYPTEAERAALGMPPYGAIFGATELYELSVCPVPANPYALTREVAKSIAPSARKFGEAQGILSSDEDFSDIDKAFEDEQAERIAALAEQKIEARERAKRQKQNADRLRAIVAANPKTFTPNEKNQSAATRMKSALARLAKL